MRPTSRRAGNGNADADAGKKNSAPEIKCVKSHAPCNWRKYGRAAGTFPQPPPDKNQYTKYRCCGCTTTNKTRHYCAYDASLMFCIECYADHKHGLPLPNAVSTVARDLFSPL